MTNAPKDGRLLKLLVKFDENSLDDSLEPVWTIGFNNLDNTGEDNWQFVGWDWCGDTFIEGVGTVLDWKEF